MATTLRPDTDAQDVVRQKMKEDGKSTSQVSTSEFLTTILVAVPIWATLLLPLTLGYRVFKAVSDKFSTQKEFVPQSPIDSGFEVQEKDIFPRSKRTYDVVVLGATGFAGKLAARHLAQTYGVNKEIKWAIAGRSKSKLEDIKKWLAEEQGIEGAQEIQTIVVDTTIPNTLPSLVQDTRAVVTTAGPFWQYGSTVVEFCAKFGTHYADITAEGGWVKTMMLKWQETAKKTGAKMISFAGHDSIPWELSVSTLADTLKSEYNEDLVEVSAYDEMAGGISGGTVATMMLMMGDGAPEGPSSDPFLLSADGTLQEDRSSSSISLLPSKIMKPWDKEETYGSPFLMAPVNFDVVSWSQTLRAGKPIKYSEVSVCPDFKSSFVSFFNLVLLFTGLLNPITKYLFANYVLPKPGEGPPLQDMDNQNFLTVTMEGTGSGGTKLKSSMYFPKDAGYVDTARMAVECGLAMALEETELPVDGGGFFTPGFALGGNLLRRLKETGTLYEMVKV